MSVSEEFESEALHNPGRPVVVRIESAGKCCASCRFARADHCDLFNTHLAVELVESAVQRGVRGCGVAHYIYELRSPECLKAEEEAQ